MKRRVICLLILCLFILFNTAFATNWVYIGKWYDYDFGNDASVYVDTDSVTHNGSNIVFRDLNDFVFEEDGYKFEVRKIEATTTNPRKWRMLEYYRFDAHNHEIDRGNGFSDFREVDELTNQEIDFALQYLQNRPI
jgi:hypothetical protein